MPRGVSIYDRAILQRRLWTPDTADSLACWYNAVIPGGVNSINGVIDLSDRGRHLTMTGISTFAPGSPITLDGSTQVLNNTSTGIGSAENVTLLLSCVIRSNDGGYNGMFAASSATNTLDYTTGLNLDLGVGSTTSFNNANIEGIKGTGVADRMPGNIAFGSPVLLALTYATEKTELRTNGGAFIGTRTTSSASPSLNLIGFGARRSAANGWGSGTYANYDFYGAAIYTRQLQTWEIERAEGWLAWSTGLQSSLRPEHPFYNRPPLIGD